MRLAAHGGQHRWERPAKRVDVYVATTTLGASRYVVGGGSSGNKQFKPKVDLSKSCRFASKFVSLLFSS